MVSPRSEVLAEWYIKLLATGLDIPLLSKQQMAEVLEV